MAFSKEEAILDNKITNLIEAGTSGTAEYWKYDNGLLICKDMSAGTFNVNNASGALFYSNGQLFTFPETFNSIPNISPVVDNSGPTACWGFTASFATTGVRVGGWGVANTGVIKVGYIAVGTWK